MSDTTMLLNGLKRYIVVWALSIIVLSPDIVSTTRTCYYLIRCDKGQRCDGDKCLECDHGTFQPDGDKKYTECTPWKSKPGEHFVVKVEGTTKTDRIWGCESGYRLKHYTPTEQVCVEETSSDTSVLNKTSIAPSTTTQAPGVKNETNSGSALSTEYIVLIIAGVIILLVVIAVVLLRRRFNRKDTEDPKGGAHKKDRHDRTTPGSGEHEVRVPLQSTVESGGSMNNSAQQVPSHRLAYYLISKLDTDKMKIFFMQLPSHPDFNTYHKFNYKQEATKDSETPYCETFIEWWDKNPGMDADKITTTLIEMDQAWVTQSEQYINLITLLKSRKIETNGCV